MNRLQKCTNTKRLVLSASVIVTLLMHGTFDFVRFSWSLVEHQKGTNLNHTASASLNHTRALTNHSNAIKSFVRNETSSPSSSATTTAGTKTATSPSKTGASIASNVSPDPKPSNFTQFYYLHIPKAGGYSMHSMLSSNGAWVYNSGMGEPTKHFDKWARSNPMRRVFMTEGIGFNQFRPPHSLDMFRNPETHVISQYFHCTESKDHRGLKGKMPSTLLEWLKAWDTMRQSKPESFERTKGGGARLHWHDPTFRCYNPVNLQSWLVGFPQSKEELRSWFDAIGILSEFKTSSCLFLTTALGHVPPICDCSQGAANVTTTTKPKRRVGHGVTHHGDTFQPTDEQLSLIHNITKLDRVLYQYAEEIFEEQVLAAERHYNVTLCRK